MVTLHNADATELRNFNYFMMALCRCFEDPLADCKAHNHIKNHEAEPLTCGQDLACHIDWPEDILVSWFKDGLNNDLYNACLAQGAPNRLHDWYVLAEEVEMDMARNQYRESVEEIPTLGEARAIQGRQPSQ